MKKYLLFLVAGLMMVASLGCSKKEETVQEVMEKVQKNYADAYGLKTEIDADYTMSLSGVEIKMDMDITASQENIQDPEHLVMEMEMDMNVLGQTMTMKEWIQDGVVYIDDSQTKTKQELNASELDEMSGKMGTFSQDGIMDFVENATMEKTEDGYLVKSGGNYADAFEELMSNLGLDELMGVDVSEVLSTLEVEEFNIEYNISKKYELEKTHIDFKAKMTIEGQEVTMDLGMDMKIETYDKARIQLPDFSDWNISSVSCSFEGEGISELMVMNAKEDNIVEVQSYMVIDYAAYGIEEEDKEIFIQNMQEMYQSYDGVECTADDLGDEMGISIIVDMNKAELSTLIELGLASEGSIEGQGFSLAQSIVGLQASGYDCK